MAKKTFMDAHEGEIFTDNSKIKYCDDCKNCIYRSDGTIWTNDYRKAYCAKYPYPTPKPIEVINNEACELWDYDPEA